MGQSGRVVPAPWHSVQPLLPLLAGSGMGRPCRSPRGLFLRDVVLCVLEVQLPELQKASSVCQPPPCCKGSREVHGAGPLQSERESCGVAPSPAQASLPNPQHLAGEKGSSCCLARQLGAVEHRSPPAPWTVEASDHPAVLHPAFYLPAVLVAWAIHQASRGSCGPSWQAGRCSLPCISSYHTRSWGQVRLGLAL